MSQRNMNKTMSKRRGKTKDDKNKNQFDKRRKDNKTLSQKRKRKWAEKKTLTEDNKKKEPKIKVPAHELLAFTLSYLMLTPW
jgi:hypothetical protein